MPVQATRPSLLATAFFLFSVCSLGVLFVAFGASPVRADEDQPQPDCSGVFADVGICRTGADGSADAAPTAIPTPTPTPTPDPAVERAQALAQAKSLVLAQIEAPGWQIWPHHTDNQVVALTTFFQVTENWETYTEVVTVGTQTVSVTARPEWSHWTWAEASGVTVPVPCRGPGTEWQPGLTTTTCGWTPEHSSSEIGDVEISTRLEYRVTSSTGTNEIVFTDESERRTLCVAEVLTYGTNGSSTPDHACEGADTGGGDNPDGTVPGVNAPQAGDSDLPVSTLSCRGTVQITGNLLGGEADGVASLEYIVQEFADGSRVLTLAGDAGGNLGVGPAPLGAAVQAGDLVVGAYLEGGASLLGTGGGGVEYRIPDGQSIPDFLGELAIGTALSPVSSVGNFLVPFGDPFPQGPEPAEPDSVFLDATVGVSAGGTGVIGIGFLAATATAGAEAEVNSAVKLNSDGTISEVVTYSGRVGGEASVGGGIPFLDFENANVGATAQGSVSIETISRDGVEIETIVTVSYGSDADAVGFGGEDDALSITTQQWTYDLTNQAVADAVGSLDEWASLSPAQLLENPQPPPLPETLRTHGETDGPITQELTETSFTAFVGAGIVVVGAEGSLNVDCYELS